MTAGREDVKKLQSEARTLVEDARKMVAGSVKGPPDRRLFFLHIQKCGGTSLFQAMRRPFLSANPLHSHRVVHLRARAAYLAAKTVGQGMYTYRQRLSHYFLQDPDNAFIAGHFQLDPDLVGRYRHEVGFVTMLREPVKKWFSHYLFNRYKPQKEGRIDLEIPEYLETKRAHDVGCDYVQLLTGLADAPTTHARDREAIESALSCIDEFAVVGVLERMDWFKADFREAFGVDLRVLHSNPSPTSHNQRQREDRAITPESRERVEKICKPNRIVYDHVLHQLQERHARAA